MNVREDYLVANRLTEYIRRDGTVLKRSGGELVTNRCPNSTHKDGHLCVSIDDRQQVWNCHDCQVGGSIIDWLMHEQGRTAGEILSEFEESQKVATKPNGQKSDEIEATYDYTDENGKLLYQVVRYKPKTFRQRQPDGDGWKWGLEGVTRVLFNLPKILQSQTVFVCEGEKDCQTLERLGCTATTNAGGSSGWLPAYGSYLKGKDVIVIPDADFAGRKHAESVVASLADRANSIKQVSIPQPAKDVTDFVQGFGDDAKAKKELDTLVDLSPHTLKPLPLYSIAEMEKHYRQFVRKIGSQTFDFGKMIPSLGKIIGLPMFPGEVALILADTGVGKSALCQTIAKAASPMPTLFFELELPLDMMFVRFVQMEIGCFHEDVVKDYQHNEDEYWKNFSGLHHITVCPESGLTCQQIESYIQRSELKIGQPPALVIVDYIGLIRSQGSRSRYEAISHAAEEMKVIAKRTETIIILASQVSRPPKDKQSKVEINLHDGKDSGALENSCGIVLGCWRPEREKMVIKVLKNTKGASGEQVEVNFDGAKMRITEAPLVFAKNGTDLNGEK